MKNSNKAIVFLSIIFTLPLFIFGCNKGNKVGKDLRGEWEIVSYQRSEIYPDGSEVITEDLKNVGEWRFSKSEISQSGFIIHYRFNYYASEPMQTDTGTIFISDEGKRMIFIEYWCRNTARLTVGCDMMYNIKEHKSNRLVIEQYKPKGFNPVDNINSLIPGGVPESEAVTFKLKMEMRRR